MDKIVDGRFTSEAFRDGMSTLSSKKADWSVQEQFRQRVSDEDFLYRVNRRFDFMTTYIDNLLQRVEELERKARD